MKQPLPLLLLPKMKKIILIFVIIVLCSYTVTPITDIGTHRSFSLFDISGVDNLASVNWISLKFTVLNIINNMTNCTIHNISIDPYQQTNESLYIDSKDGSVYEVNSDDFYCNETGIRISNLSTIALDEMLNAINNNLNNFSIGISKNEDEYKEGFANLSSVELVMGYTRLTKILKVNFTYPTAKNNTYTSDPLLIINATIQAEDNLKESNFYLGMYEDQLTTYNFFDYRMFAFYNFDNRTKLGEGNNYISDLSYGDENNSITITGAIINTTDCIQKNCIQFDGINDYLNPASPNPGYFHDSTTSRTYILNLRINKIANFGTKQAQTILEEGGWYSGFTILGNYTENNEFRGLWCIQNADDLDITYFTIPDDEQWHHYAFIFDGIRQNSSVYIDGILENITNISMSVVGGHGSEPRIGYQNGMTACDMNASYLNGTIDNLMIFNIAKSNFVLQQYFNTFLTKLDSNNWTVYLNYTTWHPGAVWNTNRYQIAFNFNESSLFAYNISITDDYSNYNQTETRYWMYSLVPNYAIGVILVYFGIMGLFLFFIKTLDSEHIILKIIFALISFLIPILMLIHLKYMLEAYPTLQNIKNLINTGFSLAIYTLIITWAYGLFYFIFYVIKRVFGVKDG